MALKASIRSLERRAAKAFPAPPCNCPWMVVVDDTDPRPEPRCPECGKNRTVIILETQAGRAALEERRRACSV